MRSFKFTPALIGAAFLTACLSAIAEAPSPAEAFRGHDPDSRLTIGYQDLNSLLNTVVLDTGPSDRAIAKAVRSSTGTRVKTSVNRATINEGNRFYFEIFADNEENQEILRGIRNRLETLPSLKPLEQFARDEQLAYWLNLYNVTMLDEIVKIYPKRNLKGILVGEASIRSRKMLTVAGVPLSLDDIQYGILKDNYDGNPLIIYGLYQGIIGGPDIRKSAFSGKTVYADLADNAAKFINSNRGTQARNKRVFRVSSLYQRNDPYFDDFQSDLTAHLLRYLEGEERDELLAAATIEADISDWTVTDLYGSYREASGSLANSSAALIGSVRGRGTQSAYLTSKASMSRFSPAVTQQLGELTEKSESGEQESIGVVTIEAVEDSDP